jgi:type II secretion system protein I
MSESTKAEDAASAGFTLIEVLCALAISALALVYLMQSLSSSQRAARQIDDQLGASIVAQSVLTEERQTFVSPSGLKSGDEGKYHWEVTALPINSSLAGVAPPGFSLYRLVVSVSWYPRGNLQLETVKLGR